MTMMPLNEAVTTLLNMSGDEITLHIEGCHDMRVRGRMLTHARTARGLDGKPIPNPFLANGLWTYFRGPVSVNFDYRKKMIERGGAAGNGPSALRPMMVNGRYSPLSVHGDDIGTDGSPRPDARIYLRCEDIGLERVCVDHLARIHPRTTIEEFTPKPRDGIVRFRTIHMRSIDRVRWGDLHLRIIREGMGSLPPFPPPWEWDDMEQEHSQGKE